MKVGQKIAPNTIRHYKGAFSRVLRWAVRKFPASVPVNPLDALPIGYVNYTRHDQVASGVKRVDQERDRRLEDDEELRIRNVLNGGVPEGRDVAVNLKWVAALCCVFDLALETGMRMREIHTLTLKQVDIANRTIFLQRPVVAH
jgi:integrase